MDEFRLIEQYFNWGCHSVVGVGDDCAIINPSVNTQLLSSVDTFIEGVHFPENTSAGDIAYKALAVNLSDVAAMGAMPKYFTLALTLPRLNSQWLGEFSASLRQLANHYNIDLIGGDTTQGTLSITINIIAEVAIGKALLRSSAQVGDLIFISNTLGDAAYAWQQIQQGSSLSAFYLNRFNRPTPRVLLGQKLGGIANACIDISDGLEQDLSHILQCSKVGGMIDLAAIPLSKAVQKYIQNTQDWCVALAGGDDYELCFTVPKHSLDKLKKIENESNIKLTKIGIITKNKGLKIEKLGVLVVDKKCHSYQHFSNNN